MNWSKDLLDKKGIWDWAAPTLTLKFSYRLTSFWRSKCWTYKSKFCLSVGVSVFHSLSNFVGFLLVKALPIGTSAPTVQSYTLSYTVLALRARVGARVEVKKNDLGKVSKKILGIKLVSGPRFSALVHSDFLAWMTSATLRFFSLAELCHTQIY